jgi:hypothetical protein
MLKHLPIIPKVMVTRILTHSSLMMRILRTRISVLSGFIRVGCK